MPPPLIVIPPTMSGGAKEVDMQQHPASGAAAPAGKSSSLQVPGTVNPPSPRSPRRPRPPHLFADLSSRSRIFRAKLIEEFRLAEAHADTGTGPGDANAPTFSSAEMETDPERFTRMLRETPGQLVRFKIFKRSQFRASREKRDRRMTRMRNINSLPLGVWAAWLVEHKYFALSINLMILLNAIILGLQSEMQAEHYPEANKVFSMIDLSILLFFMLEIALKWIDSFENFWSDRWNVFDAFITIASIVPEVVLFFPTDDPQQATQISGIAKNLRILRTLRTLKAVVRFGSLRVIVHTILNAFQSMSFILITLLMVAYIVAVFGVQIFEQYTYSEEPGLLFQEKFRNIGEALLTLFQLLSLDQWYAIQRDIAKVVSPVVTGLYFIVWVWLGGFIFRNVFVGVMVAKFQALSEMLAKEDEENKKRKKLERLGMQLHNTLQTAVRHADGGDNNNAAGKDGKGVNNNDKGNNDNNKNITDPTDGAKREPGANEAPMGTTLAVPKAEDSPKGRIPVGNGNANGNGNGNGNGGGDEAVVASAMTPKSSSATLLSGRDTLVSRDDAWRQNGQLKTLQSLLVKSSPDAAVWESTVGRAMKGLIATRKETMWPRDTLFTYLQTMESLQENLREYEELQLLASYALHTMHDA